jgi:DNA-binding NarL/FixJ family response regulator
MKKIRVLLADDHRMFLAGLKKLLEHDFEIVDAVEDGRAMLAAAAKWKPDVIVADISMPLLNGIDAAHALVAEGCQAKLIFLTMHGDALYVRQALSAGASAYILKRDAPDELVDAIRNVHQGKRQDAPTAFTGFPDNLSQQRNPEADRLGEITPRQREIWQLLAEGRTAKEIAWTMRISVRTVEFHKYRLLKRLGIRTNAELAAMAVKHGLTA